MAKNPTTEVIEIMDPKKVADIKALIARLVGPTGAFVLMLHDGKATQVWSDGDNRLKIRGLLDAGNEYLRGSLGIGLAPLV
jgi:hypothetical protein